MTKHETAPEKAERTSVMLDAISKRVLVVITIFSIVGGAVFGLIGYWSRSEFTTSKDFQTYVEARTAAAQAIAVESAKTVSNQESMKVTMDDMKVDLRAMTLKQDRVIELLGNMKGK